MARKPASITWQRARELRRKTMRAAGLELVRIAEHGEWPEDLAETEDEEAYVRDVLRMIDRNLRKRAERIPR